MKEALLKYDEIQTRIYMRSAYYFVQPMKISALMQKNYQYVCQHFTATVFNSKNIMNISWMRCYMTERSEFSIRLQLEYKTSNVNIETVNYKSK